MIKNKLGLLATSALIASFCVSNIASAQVDEIVVTARKRASTLQDTPIAMSAVTADSLEESQIRDAQDLTILVPSLTIPQFANPSATTFTVRGIGTSGFNAGLEPSVGVFIDGVYRSRAGSAINDFIAVERIEVLRGPQSTLYGKNTPAGVLSIITKKPQFQFGVDAEVTVGNYDLRVFKGSVTGPIGDSEAVAFRLSGNRHVRNGYFTNDFDGRDLNDRDRFGLRGELLIEPRDDISVRLIADYNSLEEECCSAAPVLHAPGPAFALTNLPSGPTTLITRDPFDRHISVNGDVFTDNETAGLSAEVNVDLGNMAFTSITAYRTFDEANNIDADFVDASLVENRHIEDDFKTFTQEFRLASTGENTVDWMVGGYFFDQDLNTNNRTIFGDDARPYADTLSSLLTGGAASLTSVEQLFLLGQAIGLDTTQGQPFFGTGFVSGPVTPGSFFGANTGLGFDFNQHSQSYSLFGSVDWHVSDQLTVTGGLRWTNEDKDVIGAFTTDDLFSSLDLNNLIFLEQFPAAGTPLGPFLSPGPLPRNVFAGFVPLQPFGSTADFSDTRSEDKVTGNFILSYDVNDNMNVYGSFSRGYKAGGFNLSQSTRVTGRDFASETMDSYELGWKTKLWDNRVRFSGAAFMQTLKDFQSNTFNGVNFDLSNAGSVSIDGVEWDILAKPTDQLTLTFGGSYLDAEYDEFLTGPSIVGSASPITDLSGERLPGVSKWNMSGGGTYRMDIGESFEGFIHADAIYRSHFAPGTDLNPLKEQPSSIIVGASAGIGNADQGWELSVWGKNITDEKVFQGVFDTVFQAGSLSGYPIAPPTYGVTLRVHR